MKFSRNILSTFIDIKNISDEALCGALNDIGLELESSRKISVPKSVVIGKVIERLKHPDADKLSVCKVDIGSEILQIVCGAKNVDKGQFVAVALVGAKIGTMEIKKSVLRGIESNGMLCSATELGLNKINDGILVLDSSLICGANECAPMSSDLTLGRELAEYELFNDTIFEISITPNRGDCLSVLGIARDLACVFNLELKLIKEKEESEIIPGIGRVFNISFDENLQSSLFYKVAELKNVENSLRLQLFLSLIDELGDEPLENITKYATYMSGVLFNAYKFDNNGDEKTQLTIKAESAKKAESNAIECVYHNDKIISRIGIGAEKKYLATHKSHFVAFEASYIPPDYIAKAIFESKIKADEKVAYLSTRGSSPLLEIGMIFLCNVLKSMSQSTIYLSSQHILQTYPQKQIDVDLGAIRSIIGAEIPNDEMLEILKKMEFKISKTSQNDTLVLNPPLYRHDLNNVADVAEEILRIKGIDSIPPMPQVFKQYKNMDNNFKQYRFRRQIATRAISQRFFECIHYLFAKKESLEFYGYESLPKKLDIANPITSDLNTLRTSLIPQMLDSVQRNKNYGYTAIRLFEIGSIYDKNRAESSSLAFVVSGDKESPKYPHPKPQAWDFYAFANVINDIIGAFECKQSPKNGGFPIIYHPNMSASVVKNGKIIGKIGKINPQIASKIELDNECFICEIAFDALFDANVKVEFGGFSKFQASSRDITILLDENITFEQVKAAILAENFKHLHTIIPLDVYRSDEFGTNVSLSFQIVFQSPDSTLEQDDLKIDGIVELLNSKFGATLR